MKTDLYESLKNPVKWVSTTLPLHGKISLILDPMPPGIDTIISDKHYLEENVCFADFLDTMSKLIEEKCYKIIRHVYLDKEFENTEVDILLKYFFLKINKP